MPTSLTERRPRTDLSGKERRSKHERLLIWLEALLAIGAIEGAVGIVWGNFLGEAVDRLPFGSAVFAGVALAIVNGFYPLAVVTAELRCQPWVRWGHPLVGLALMGWIVVQVTFLGPPVHWLQALYLVWGLVTTTLAFGLHEERDPRR